MDLHGQHLIIILFQLDKFVEQEHKLLHGVLVVTDQVYQVQTLLQRNMMALHGQLHQV